MTETGHGGAPAALDRGPRPAAPDSEGDAGRTEFLSPHGIRALSRRHMAEPYRLQVDGIEYTVGYEPAESRTGLFGGNSNWRGPIWFPVNYLLIEALQTFHHYYGDDFTVECPTGSGQHLTLAEVAQRAVAPADADLPARRTAGGRRERQQTAVPARTRTGATWCCSTSTSTATRAKDSARATRPAGRRWWPSCCSRAGE